MAYQPLLCQNLMAKTSSNECPEYDIKQLDGEAPVLELWEMLSTPSLSSSPKVHSGVE